MLGLFYGRRSLSNMELWTNFNLCYLCCLIVVILNTFQLVNSDTNPTAFHCPCNSTTTGSSNLNATETTCNCTNDIKCKQGYQILNGTCVACLCNSTTKPINCNCSDVPVPSSKVCSHGQFLSNSSQECVNCSCNVHTSLHNDCDNRTGQCFCRENMTGQHCTICAANYTANYSSSGELLSCLKHCPMGFKRVERDECIKMNSTSSLPLDSTHGIIMSTDNMVLTSISSTPVLTSLSTEVPSSPKTSSIYLVPSSNSPIIPSPSSTMELIQTPSPTPSSPPLLSSSSSSPSHQPSSPPSSIPPSSSPSSPSPSSSMPPSSIPSSPSSSLPSSSIPPSSSSSSSPPPTTATPISTNTPPTSTNAPTTGHIATTGQESSPKPTTEKPSSEKPTTKAYHTKQPSKDNSSDTVVIVLTCLGVVALIAIAIGVGCYCLRSKRKPSTPFWTVELSNTRNNEELDFALLDPVTDQPHKKANDTGEADASITEHSRYYAYI